MKIRAAWSLVSLLCVVACADDDSPSGLSNEDVEDIAEGDAQGSEASGRYEVESYTSSCEGRCRIGDAQFWVSVCDVCDRDEQWVEVEQREGRLQIDGDDSLFVSRLIGGIDADGTFEVGGFGTEVGGAVETTLSCRLEHVSLAALDPEVHCSHIGVDSPVCQ